MIDMTAIISFDLDGTLMKSTYADVVWLEGLPSIYAREKRVPFEQAKTYLQQEYDTIGDNRVEWYDLAYWFQRFQLRSSWKDLLETYRSIIEPYPETQEVVQRLAATSELLIISNAKREFIDIELAETNLTTFFTWVFSSTSDFHKVKKVADFYNTICKKLHISPENMIHVGDHYEFDYTIPQSMGITSFYLDRTKTRKGLNIVYDLREFEKRITTL